MAETDSSGCRCSNISIMQLFHELKQKFPKVPDQIVSKIIQQNFHDKVACETLLQQESNLYVQCFPGALISGETRQLGVQGPISDHCSAGPAHPTRFHPVPRRVSDTGSLCSRGTTHSSAAAALPTSQQQTDADVSASLPLSAAHARGCLTPPRDLSHSAPSSSRTALNECDWGSTHVIPETSSSNPVKITANSPNEVPGSKRAAESDAENQPLPPSVESKVEPLRLPLGQLVLEDCVSEQKKGCESSACNNPPVNISVTASELAVKQTCNSSVGRLSSTSSTPASSRQSTPRCHGDPELLARTSVDLRASLEDSCGKIPEYAPLLRATSLSCDNRDEAPPKPINTSGQQRHESQPLSAKSNPPKRKSPLGEVSSKQSSPSKSVSHSANLLAPPTCSNPFLKSSHPHRLSTPFNDLSADRPSPSNSETDAPKEYKVAVECVVCPSTPGDQQRSFTSVNLTLRPPSAETTLPIDITSGQSLTYTTASFDQRQGYQSHLQIRIGPVGGSVTACRTRVSSPVIRTSSRSPCRGGAVCQARHHVRALLQQQRERKEVLARALRREKERLHAMQAQVQSMKIALARAASTPVIISKLKADIDRLRSECESLTAAVDSYSDQSNPADLPLGAGWSCRICTFRNHPLLSVCEECEMPRLSLGTRSADPVVLSNPVLPNNNSSCAAGETSTSVSRTITPLQER